MKVAVCRSVINKSKDFETLATGFVGLDLTQAELAHEIDQGHAFTTHHTGRRQAENFNGAGFVALDFDDVLTANVEFIMGDELVADHYGIFYRTPSHTPQNPRFRLIFQLGQPIDDATTYRRTVAAFMWRLGTGGADRTCKDPCRLFYGSKDSQPTVTEHVIPLELVEDICSQHEAYLEAQAQARPAAPARLNGPANNSTGQGNGSDKGKKAYLAKVLEAQCDKVRQAGKGHRHETLRGAARLMGGYLAGVSSPQLLEEYDVRSQLEAAYSTHSDLNQREMLNTISWSLERGQREPLYVPDLTPAPTPAPARAAKAKGPAAVGPATSAGQDQGHGQKVDLETGEVIEPGPGPVPEVDSDSALAEFEPNDEGNGEAFRSIYGDDFLYCGAFGWLSWNGKFWDASLAEARLDAKVTEVLRRRRLAAVLYSKEAVVKASITNRGRINACIEGLRQRLAVSIDDFDNNPDLINCQNGVVNLKTGQLISHDKTQRFTYCIPTSYNPGADYKPWTDFLSQVIGDGAEVVDYLQKAVGYSLTGHTSEECLFYCYGPTRGGKGTFTEAMLELLGYPLTSEVDFNTFTATRDGDSSNFDLAQLRPAHIVFASESTRYRPLNAAKVKALTGGNRVRCCFKHKDFFSYRPRYSIWLTSNWPVNGDVDDDALWGRLRVISFPHTYLGKEDKSLKQRIKSPETLEGILTWAVEGAMAWYKAGNNGLKAPEQINTATEAQRSEADYVQSWLDECCDTSDKTSWESHPNIISSYREWCNLNGTEPKGMKQLSTTLRTKGFTTGVQHKIDGVNHKGVQGIRLLARARG
jgi:putative DNA primase/helicase